MLIIFNFHPIPPRIEVKERAELHLFSTSVPLWHVIRLTFCLTNYSPVPAHCLGNRQLTI